VISPNETELMRMTGMPTDDELQITAAAEVLFKKGVAAVLCKLGSKGSLMLRRDGKLHLLGSISSSIGGFDQQTWLRREFVLMASTACRCC
jgi:sugar/nucleoside kinase (ribokinase family)